MILRARMDQASIAQRLREARDSISMTREQVEEACGIPASTLKKWELNLAAATAEGLAKLVSVYRKANVNITAEGILGIQPREFPAGYHLFNDVKYQEIIRLAEKLGGKVSERAGRKYINTEEQLVRLSIVIPEGAIVIDAIEADRRQEEAEQLIEGIAPKAVDEWLDAGHGKRG